MGYNLCSPAALEVLITGQGLLASPYTAGGRSLSAGCCSCMMPVSRGKVEEASYILTNLNLSYRL